MATSEGIPSSIDIEFLELNDNPYLSTLACRNSMTKTDSLRAAQPLGLERLAMRLLNRPTTAKAKIFRCRWTSTPSAPRC